jgi:SAM-dependent methyltransferase
MAQGGAHDWEVIASRDAFFGVVSADEYRAGKLDADARARFYASGRQDIARLLEWMDVDLRARPAGRALDIGCGVGRLSHAMAAHVREVVGYDVSATMIAHAREGAPANLALTTAFPAGPFDWINSYIVFQHIPPAEGLALLDACLAAAAPRAILSLQLTGWRDGAQPSASLPARARRWLQRLTHRRPGQRVDALIRMHDYNFSDVLQRATAHGFSRVVLRHTQHAGHHGAWLLAQRD